jgi:hypothetical protein
MTFLVRTIDGLYPIIDSSDIWARSQSGREESMADQAPPPAAERCRYRFLHSEFLANPYH